MLVGRDDEDAIEAASLAAAVGLRNVAGYLAGGMTSWREETLDVERVERMTVPELHERWAADATALQILDVRERGGVGRRPHPRLGPRALPRHRRAARRASTPAARSRSICGSGQRSAVAASLLKRFGAARRHPRRRRRRAALAARGLAGRAPPRGGLSAVLAAIPFGAGHRPGRRDARRRRLRARRAGARLRPRPERRGGDDRVAGDRRRGRARRRHRPRARRPRVLAPRRRRSPPRRCRASSPGTRRRQCGRRRPCCWRSSRS